MGMSTAYGRRDEATSKATLERAVERGVTLFDTANMYGNGANEELLGRHLKRHRARITLATKTGIRTLPLVGMPIGFDGRPKSILRSAEASLRRLDTDVLDLFYLHRPDPKVPIEESIGAMAQLVTTGKVREIGVSEVSPDQLRRAHATHRLAALQIEWSIFSREAEGELAQAAHELGIGIVAYSPLGRGMLTGSAAATTELSGMDFRRLLPRWRKANLAENLRQVEIVQEIASQLGATPAQVALAWLLQRDDSVVPIPGTSRPSRLEENLAALELNLSGDQVARLDAIRAAGGRR